MKCSSCSNKAVYYRANEGRYYCKNHFCESIEKKVKKTITLNNLVDKKDVIYCALSGGKDSTNNIFLLKKFYDKNPKIKIFALTIDEGIRGYRDKSIKVAKRFCNEYHIEHHIVSFKKEFGFTLDQFVKKHKENVCTYCGVFRRYLLNKKAKELGATKLATGHNLDDEVQSMIMNIIKGDTIRLVRCGAKPFLFKHKKFVTRIKPLVEIPERESALYALVNELNFYPADCSYAVTNALRGQTRDFLNKLEDSSPGIKYSLVRSMYKLIPLISNDLPKEKIGTCEKCGEPSSHNICKVCQIIG